MTFFNSRLAKTLDFKIDRHSAHFRRTASPNRLRSGDSS
jgi:hypothetical protein